MDIALMLSNAALLAFAIASGIFVRNYRHPGPSQNVGLALYGLGTAAISLATFADYHGEIWSQSAGLLLVFTLSWLIAVAYVRYRVHAAVTFVTPIMTLILFIDFFFGYNTVPRDHTEIAATILSGIHVLMAVVGEAFGIGAAAVGGLFIIQHYALKRKQLDRIPNGALALDRLSQLLIGALWIGLAFISAGLVSGAVFTRMYISEIGYPLALKIIWGLAVWGFYLLTLFGFNVFRWSTLTVARLSVAGFVLLSISLFGLAFFRGQGAL